MAVSELEKNAEPAISRASIRKSRPVLVSLKGYLGAGWGSAGQRQQDLADQLAAEECQHQQDETAEGQADGIAAAPAAHMPAPEQYCKYHPGQAGKEGLVCHALGPHVVQEYEAGQQRQGQQHLTTQQELEQQRFHGLQGREGMIEAHRVAVTQLVVLERQQGSLEGGNGQDAVGQYRQQHVNQQGGMTGHGGGPVVGEKPGQQLGDQGEGKQHHQQTGDRRAEAEDQGNGDHQPGNKGGNVEKPE